VRSTKYHPSVKYSGRIWRFWQYQSDGHVPGVDGKVDCNAFSGSADAWQTFLSASAASAGAPVQADKPPASLATAEATGAQ